MNIAMPPAATSSTALAAPLHHWELRGEFGSADLSLREQAGGYNLMLWWNLQAYRGWGKTPRQAYGDFMESERQRGLPQPLRDAVYVKFYQTNLLREDPQLRAEDTSSRLRKGLSRLCKSVWPSLFPDRQGPDSSR